MRDGTVSLDTFLTAAPEGTPLLITGRSLGGCLASALAPCVANWINSAASISVYTIAAPSPGNADFAGYYNALFTDQAGDSTAFRFFNSLDVVPNAWASLNRHTTRRWCLALPVSAKSSLAPKTPWLGSTFNSETSRRVAQSN